MCLLGVLGGKRSEAVIPVYDMLKGSRDIESVKQHCKQRKRHCRVRRLNSTWQRYGCLADVSLVQVT